MRPARLAAPLKNIKHLLRVGPLSMSSPGVMGILNVTPDSFSDGGRFIGIDAACSQADAMVAAGAAIIDIGGESTRPGAAAVSEAEELDRVIPIIEALRGSSDLPISIDTSKPVVMREAVAAGAAMVNDVLALREPGAIAAVAELGVPVCLMHMQGTPRTMQKHPHYDDVATEVAVFLEERVAECVAGGVERAAILIDPGFGFGKSHDHNVQLLANLGQLQKLELPILVGLSRKSTLGHLTGREVGDRLAASLAAAVIAALQGAQIVRAHDVRETVDALRVVSAVMDTRQ